MENNEEKLRRSFDNVRSDMQTLNAWLYSVHQTQEAVPKKFEEMAGSMVESLEKSISSLDSMLRSVSKISRSQTERMDFLEKKVEDLEKALDEVKSSELTPRHVDKLKPSERSIQGPFRPKIDRLRKTDKLLEII